LERGYIQRQQRTDERLSNVERRHAKVEDVVDKVRSYTDKVERKLKEVVEQNVSIKILVDSIKAKQAYHERQMSQMTGLITQQVPQHISLDINDVQKRCDEILHQARAEITKAFYENAMQDNQPKST
jgi:uncharacterized protein YhaN